MGLQKCCVPGCDDKTTSRQHSPNPKSGRFSLWLQTIGDKELMKLQPVKIYRRKVICKNHFSDHQFYGCNRNFRLSDTAIPDRFLTATSMCCNPPQSGVGVSAMQVEPVFFSADTPPHSGVGEFDMEVEPNDEPVFLNAEEPFSQGPQTPPSPLRLTPLPVMLETPPALIRKRIIARRRNTTSKKNYDFNVHENSIALQFIFSFVWKQRINAAVNVKRCLDASPKTKVLIKTYQVLNRKAHRSDRKLKSFKKRSKLAEKSLDRGDMMAFTKLSPVVARFVLCQIREAQKGRKGHRFTLEEKVYALALFKRSGRAYDFLSEAFVLPARSTLNRFTSGIKMNPGINDKIFLNLKNVIKKMKRVDRHCILMFDEMALSANLSYNDHLGLIEGFQNLGNGKTSSKFADKALVCMIRVLARRYKQPVAFFSPSGQIKSAELSTLILEVVEKLTQSGLKVMATVCDHCSSNVAAINSLVVQTRQEVLRRGGEMEEGYFTVSRSEDKIIPLFEPPHLLKGVRISLINYDLVCTVDGEELRASWRHVLQAYAIDCKWDRVCPFLTDLHVIPGKVKKMKVKYCAQVFSNRTASYMSQLPHRSCGGDIEESAIGTSKVFKFLNNLFDSVNGVAKTAPESKPYLCAISESSPHMDFWRKALQTLESMAFVNESKRVRTPSLNNWVRKIKKTLGIYGLI